MNVNIVGGMNKIEKLLYILIIGKNLTMVTTRSQTNSLKCNRTEEIFFMEQRITKKHSLDSPTPTIKSDEKYPYYSKLDRLCYKDKGLTEKEREYVNKRLTKDFLYIYVNTRYTPNPVRYLKMTKQQLIDELKYDRYED